MEDGCVVMAPTMAIDIGVPPPPTDSLASYREWLNTASQNLRSVPFADLPTYLTYIVHGAQTSVRQLCVSCPASFSSGKDLEQHFWGNLPHLGLQLLRPLYLLTRDPESQSQVLCCPFCSFSSDRKCQITLHQTLTPSAGTLCGRSPSPTRTPLLAGYLSSRSTSRRPLRRSDTTPSSHSQS